MKLKTIVFGIFLTALSSSAFGHWFPGQAYVQVMPHQVSAQVYNPHFQPIICSGQVFGQTAYGAVMNGYFYEQYLPAGAYRFAFAYASPYSPFINGWANIQCRFAHFW